MCKTDRSIFFGSRSIHKEDKKRKEKYRKRTRTRKDQKVSKTPALHLTKSQPAQNLVAAEEVCTSAAGESTAPFHPGRCVREGRSRRALIKKGYKVSLSIRGEKEKARKCGAGRSELAIGILCMVTSSVISSVAILTFSQNPHST